MAVLRCPELAVSAGRGQPGNARLSGCLNRTRTNWVRGRWQHTWTLTGPSEYHSLVRVILGIMLAAALRNEDYF